MNLDEIVVRVAEGIPDFLWREGDTHEGGVVENQAIEFARRLLAEVQKVQEPVTFAVMEGDRILQLSKSQDPFYPHSTPLYKALEITE